MADFSPADVAEVTVTVVHKVKQKLGTTEYDVPIGIDEVQDQQNQNEEDDQVWKTVYFSTTNNSRKKAYLGKVPYNFRLGFG